MLEIFKDILFISFYTKDDYYIKSAASLKKQLDNLGARYIFKKDTINNFFFIYATFIYRSILYISLFRTYISL